MSADLIETRPARAARSCAVDLARYRRDGYLVVRGFFDPAELSAVLEEMTGLFRLQLARLGLEASPGRGREAFLEDALRLLRTDPALYIATARLTQMLPRAQRLMTSEALCDLARALGLTAPVVSTRVSNHIMSDALKIPGGYHKSPPHQDWRSMQGSLDSLVVWAPLTPAGPRAYPLEVVPGSHRLGLLETQAHIMTPTVSDPRIGEEDYLALTLEPGDVAAFSSFLVHRTGEEGGNVVRIAFSGRFNNAAEPSFVARGFPTPYKYSYQTELLFEGFGAAADVAGVFPQEPS
jgi:hypothetical protein